MSRILLTVFLVFLVGALAACDHNALPALPDAAMPPDLEVNCWRGTSSRCSGDWNCSPPLSTCQLGVCCTGIMDPSTCVCHCNGGPPCFPGWACCYGNTDRKSVTDPEVLKCRNEQDCSNWR